MTKLFNLTFKQVSICLTVLSIVLWIFSITQSQLEIDFWGIFGSFSLYFFISLGLLTLASALLWPSNEKCGRLLCLQLCLFVTIIHLSPILIGGNSVFADMSYALFFSFNDYIIQTDHLNSQLLWYHNWPGMWIAESYIIELFSISNFSMFVNLATFFVQLILVLPLYQLLKQILYDSNKIWMALWIFFLGNWTAQIYLAPQTLSMIYFLLLLTIVLIITQKQQSSFNVPGIILLAAVSVTHLLTSLSSLIGIALLWVIRKRKSIVILVGMLGVIFVAAWTVYSATSQIELQLPNFIDRAFRLDLLFQRHFVDSTTTSSLSHATLNRIRIYFTAVFVLIGALGFFLSIRKRDEADKTAFTLVIIPVLMVFTGFYGWELLMRSYMFALIPVGYFGTKMIRYKPMYVGLVLLFLVALPLNIVTLYGNAARDYIPKGEIAYWNFTQDKIRSGYLIGGLVRWYNNYEGRTKIDFESLEWNGDRLSFEWIQNDKALYIDIGEYDKSIMRFLDNDTTTVPEWNDIVTGSDSFDMIYTNRDLNLFYYNSVLNPEK